MTTILKYKIPEETEELETAQNGWKYKAALHDFNNFLVNMEDESLENVYNKFFEILEAREVNL